MYVILTELFVNKLTCVSSCYLQLHNAVVFISHTHIHTHTFTNTHTHTHSPTHTHHKHTPIHTLHTHTPQTHTHTTQTHTNSAHIFATNFPISTILGTKKLLISVIIHLWFIYVFDVKNPEDDLKNIETCQIICVFYVKVYFNTSAFISVIYWTAFSSVNHCRLFLTYLLSALSPLWQKHAQEGTPDRLPVTLLCGCEDWSAALRATHKTRDRTLQKTA